MIVLSTESYADLARRICAGDGFQAGEVTRKRFSDGERYLRLDTKVSGQDVAAVGGTVTEPDTLELYDLGSAAVQYGARSLTLVIPYFGYSTMERAVRDGEAVTAKYRARLLSSLPVASYGNRVFLMDLHSEGIPHYFGDFIRPVHVYAKPVILEACREAGGEDFVLACTDAGRAKWVESLANDLKVPAAFVFKKREGDADTHVTAIRASVEDRDVVIYDDMIRTGSSLLSAAEAYREAGARRISAVATHGVFPGESAQSILQSGLVEQIFCTDTHPRARELENRVQVRSVAGVLADRLRSES